MLGKLNTKYSFFYTLLFSFTLTIILILVSGDAQSILPNAEAYSSESQIEIQAKVLPGESKVTGKVCPKVTQFEINPKIVTIEDEIVVDWCVENADSVSVNGRDMPLCGSWYLRANKPGEYLLRLKAVLDDCIVIREEKYSILPVGSTSAGLVSSDSIFSRYLGYQQVERLILSFFQNNMSSGKVGLFLGILGGSWILQAIMLAFNRFSEWFFNFSPIYGLLGITQKVGTVYNLTTNKFCPYVSLAFFNADNDRFLFEVGTNSNGELEIPTVYLEKNLNVKIRPVHATLVGKKVAAIVLPVSNAYTKYDQVVKLSKDSLINIVVSNCPVVHVKRFVSRMALFMLWLVETVWFGFQYYAYNWNLFHGGIYFYLLLIIGVFYFSSLLYKNKHYGRIFYKGKPLSYAILNVYDKNNHKVAKLITDSRGYFSISLPPGIYKIKFPYTKKYFTIKLKEESYSNIGIIQHLINL